MTDKGGNGRVTIAVLGTKIDAALATLQEIRADQKAQAGQITGLQVADTALAAEIRRVDGRVSGWTVAQGAWSALLAALAGYLGTRH